MFITLEGIEGSGKTTQAKLLLEYLSVKGCPVFLTREPGWGKAGEIIRTLLLSDREVSLQPFTELCLFCADRVEHVKGFIKPKLDGGNIVVCDRYHDSTIVYQGYGRPNNKELVNNMTTTSCLGIIPDITFLLDIPVQKGLMRIKNRDNSTKFDQESIDFHERVRDGFLEQAQKEPQRIRVLDADRDMHSLQAEIREILDNKIFFRQ
jgi:dTMP kinase